MTSEPGLEPEPGTVPLPVPQDGEPASEPDAGSAFAGLDKDKEGQEKEGQEEGAQEKQGQEEEVEEKEAQEYDAAMKRWAQGHLPTVAGWLDPTVAGLAPSAYAQRVTELTAPTMRADLLIAVGKNRLLHVEYETSPRKGLVTRMFNYRGRIMVLYPQAQLAQYVIVLGDGRVRGHDRPSSGFTLDLNVIYLRERDSSDYLTDPVLAPLAALTKGGKVEREQAFGAALRLIRDSGHPMTGDLLLTAEKLARIRLDENTVNQIRKETGMVMQSMVDHYRNNEVGAYLERVAREEMLLARLQERFGDRTELDSLAKKLAERPNREALNLVTTAPDLEALLSTEATS